MSMMQGHVIPYEYRIYFSNLGFTELLKYIGGTPGLFLIQGGHFGGWVGMEVI